MNHRDATPITPVELQPLEPRLLLSGFPVVLEQPGFNDTAATAQDVTTAFAELFAGEGSHGVQVMGRSSRSEPDWYRFEVSQEVVLQSGAYYAKLYDSAQEELSNPSVVGPGTYYVNVQGPYESMAGYSLPITWTEIGDLEWADLTGDGRNLLATTQWTHRPSDPGDFFYVPERSGDVFDQRGDKTINDSATWHDVGSSSEASATVKGWHRKHWFTGYDTRETGIGVLSLLQDELWDESHDTLETAFAIPELDSIAVADGLYDYAFNVPGADASDWFEITVPEVVFVETRGQFVGADGETVEIAVPGESYYTHSGTVYFHRVIEDGFQEVQPGLWRYAHQSGPVPRKYITLVATMPEGAGIPGLEAWEMADGHYLERIDETSLGDEPKEVWAYAMNELVDGTGTSEQAADLKLLPYEGNPSKLLAAFTEVPEGGTKTYFNVTIPWDAHIDKSPVGGNLYDMQGQLVGDDVSAGDYVYVYELDGYAPSRELYVDRRLPVIDPSNIDNAESLDDFFTSLPGGRRTAYGVTDQSTWYKFTAREGEVAGQVSERTPDGELVTVRAGLPLTGGREYYLKSKPFYKGTLITLEYPTDITDEIERQFDRYKAAHCITGHHAGYSLDGPDSVFFQVSEPTMLVEGRVWTEDRDFIEGKTLLEPGTYYTGPDLGRGRSSIHLRRAMAPVNIDSLFTVVGDDGHMEAHLEGVYQATWQLTASLGEEVRIYRPQDSALLVVGPDGSRVLSTYRSDSGYEWFCTTPGTYTIYAANEMVEFVRIVKFQHTPVELSPLGHDAYRLPGREGYWVATADGVLHETYARTESAFVGGFEQGDVLFFNGQEGLVLLDSIPIDYADSDYTTRETALSVTSSWNTENPHSRFVPIRAIGGYGDPKFVRFNAQAGEVLSLSQNGWAFRQLGVTCTDAWGQKVGSVSAGGFHFPRDGEYYLEIEGFGDVKAGESTSLLLHHLSDGMIGNSFSSSPAPVSYTGTDSEPMVFTALKGRLEMHDLGSGYAFESSRSMEPLSVLSSHESEGLLTWKLNGPYRITVLLEYWDAEGGSAMEYADDIDSHLVTQGTSRTGSISSEARGDSSVWYRFEVESWSQVKVSVAANPNWSAPQLPADIRLYDTDGTLWDNGATHFSPGAVYVEVRNGEGAFILNVEVSPGEPLDDGDSVWTEATDISDRLSHSTQTIEGQVDFPGDEDWYVVKSDEVAMIRVQGPVGTFLQGQSRLYAGGGLASPGEPLYIRAEGDVGSYSFTLQRLTPRATVTLAPSAEDSHILTADLDQGQGAYLVHVPMGSRIVRQHRIASVVIPQPNAASVPPGGGEDYVYVMRDTWVVVNTRSHPSDVTVRLEVQKLPRLGPIWDASTQSTGDFLVNLPRLDGDRDRSEVYWMHLPADASGEVNLQWDRWGSTRSQKSFSSFETDVAVFFSVPRTRETITSVRGWFAGNTDTEPNDLEEQATRVDDMWLESEVGSSRLALSGRASSNNPDVYVFQAAKGEGLRSSDMSGLSIQGAVWDSMQSVWEVTDDGDVYVTLTRDYSLTIDRAVAATATDTQPLDVTQELADGQVRLLGRGFVTFETDPGEIVRGNGIDFYSDANERLLGDFVVAPGTRVMAKVQYDGALHRWAGAAMDIDGQFQDAGAEGRDATLTLAGSAEYRFTVGPNERIRWEADLSQVGWYDDPPSWFFVDADGTSLPEDTNNYYDYAGRVLPGGGMVRLFTYSDRPVDFRLVLVQTEPSANDTAATATDLTARLQPHSEGGSYIVFDGLFSADDRADYYSVDVPDGHYVTAETWGNDAQIDLVDRFARRGNQAVISDVYVDGGRAVLRVGARTDPQYMVRLTVRPVQEVSLSNQGGGSYSARIGRPSNGAGDSLMPIEIWRLAAPAGSVILAPDAKRLFDSEGRWLGSAATAVRDAQGVYIYVDQDVDLEVHPLGDLDSPVINYTHGMTQQFSGSFNGSQIVWWEAQLYSGDMLSVGRPDSADMASQTDVTVVAGPGARSPQLIESQPLPDGFSSGQVYRIVNSGKYFLGAYPGPLGDGIDYLWQIHVANALDTEPNDVRSQATALDDWLVTDEHGQKSLSMVGAFDEHNDADWYSVDVGAGHMLRVGVEPTTESRWIPLSLYDPEGRELYTHSHPWGVARMVYCPVGGRYTFRTRGSSYAYEMDVVTGPVEDVTLTTAMGYSSSLGHSIWMGRTTLPGGSEVWSSGPIYDEQGRVLDGAGGITEPGTYYVANTSEISHARLREADGTVPVGPITTIGDAEELTGTLHPWATAIDHTERLAALQKPGDAHFYAIDLGTGDALTGEFRWEADWMLQPEKPSRISILWDGVWRSFEDMDLFVADADGTAVIRIDRADGPDHYMQPYNFRLRKVQVGAQWHHAMPLQRKDVALQRGDRIEGDRYQVYGADYRFIGEGNDEFVVPSDGMYHVFHGHRTLVEKRPAVRPKQVVQLTFDGGYVGLLPELDGVDLGTLEGFDASGLGLPGNLQQAVLSRLRDKFDDLPIRIVDFQPESLPYAKVYITGSSPVDRAGLAVGDGLNANLYDDAYVFADNVLDTLRGRHSWNMLPPQQKFDMLADALANVSAAYLARAIGAQPVVDTADLMAVERWEDISAAMQFSQTDLAVTDRSYLQNTRHVLATALSTFTPGVVLETHRNDRASQAEAVLIGRDVDRPILMGSIDEVDVDHYAFELGEGATLHLNLGATSSGAKVELLDSDYAVVAEDTDADGRITRSLDAGLYYVRLTAAIDPLAPMSGAMLPAGSDALPPQSQSQYLMTMGQLGDATGDGLVNMFDFLAVRQNWLKPADSDRDDRADLNGDGLVNMFDFLAVRQNWLSQLPLSQQPQVPGDSLAPLATGGQIDVLGSAVSAPPVSGSTGQRQTSTAAEVDLLGGPTREAVAARPVGAVAKVPVARSARPLEPIAPADAERIESGSYVPTGGTGVARGEDSSEELGSPLEDVLARLGS